MHANSEDARPLVLIVDDDFAVRDSLAAVMEAFGFRTCTAGNGHEGLRAVDAEAPSAIITDLDMPEMTGFELMTALRRSKTRIPVIAMSGSAPDDVDAAKNMGAVATFHKPLSVFDLIDVVSNVTAHAA